MKKSTGKPTKTHVARFELLKEIGCIACRKEGFVAYPAEIHHLNAGGKAGQKRRGHDFTIPLCAWHHRGTKVHPGGVMLTLTMGPSLAKQSKLFRETYGSDDDLLAETNKLIGADS